MDANVQLIKVCVEISTILENTLTAFGRSKEVDVDFNREYFRMDVKIEDREYTISVNGRGGDIREYHQKLLEIINKEIDE